MKNLNSLKLGKIDKFSNMEAAFRWANNCIKLHVVVLGDDSKFWVVSFADAQKLAKQGYSIA